MMKILPSFNNKVEIYEAKKKKEQQEIRSEYFN